MLDKRALDEYLTQTPEEYYGRKEIDMCENCHGSIYDGEEYYDVDGTIICKQCMNDFKKIAGE